MDDGDGCCGVVEVFKEGQHWGNVRMNPIVEKLFGGKGSVGDGDDGGISGRRRWRAGVVSISGPLPMDRRAWQGYAQQVQAHAAHH